MNRSGSRGPAGEQTPGVRAKLLWLLIGVLIGGLLLTLIARVVPQPGMRVVEADPARGGEVGARGPLRIRFSEPLASAVPAGAVRLDGEPDPEVEVAGSTLTVRPKRQLAPAVEHTLLLGSDLLAASGERLGVEIAWNFTVREAEIAFLRQEGGIWRLYRSNASGDQLLLSSPDREVTDFAPSPDGRGVVYSARNREGGADLWWVGRDGQGRRQLVECAPDRCLDPAWAPDGQRFAFVRRPAAGEAQRGPRIWTVGLEGAEPAPLYQDPARLGTQPTWSPDGLHLAYYDPGVQGVRVLDLDTVSEQVLPTGTGLSGAWSPDGEVFLFPVMEFEGEAPLTALFRLDLSGEQVTPVLRRDGGWRQVGVPSWSPDGDRVALAAQREGAGPTPVMWRMRPDGSEAQVLESHAGFSYGGPDWDPWGDKLLFQRLRSGNPEAGPDLLIWSERTGVDLRLRDAASGRWLP